jgi:hypothetical protein
LWQLLEAGRATRSATLAPLRCNQCPDCATSWVILDGPPCIACPRSIEHIAEHEVGDVCVCELCTAHLPIIYSFSSCIYCLFMPCSSLGIVRLAAISATISSRSGFVLFGRYLEYLGINTRLGVMLVIFKRRSLRSSLSSPSSFTSDEGEHDERPRYLIVYHVCLLMVVDQPPRNYWRSNRTNNINTNNN